MPSTETYVRAGLPELPGARIARFRDEPYTDVNY